MSGIYIHIPFCRQRCHYCDFYSTTQLKRKPELVQAIQRELEIRKNGLGNHEVSTIYFGGGTPSLLTADELKAIFETIYNNFNVIQKPEITLEANPDDLTPKHIKSIKDTGVNRLSIGLQSFHNSDLEMMYRRHNSEQIYKSVKEAQDAGFNNISVDLIYGLPNSSLRNWKKNLEQISTLNIQHLSAYHLTFENKTVFDVKRKKGELNPVTDEESLKQFKALISWAKENKFEHYEISNFGKDGFYSQHNTSYWMQQKYLGVGPSAHSYNIDTRSWNVANLSSYITNVMQEKEYFETEVLSIIDKHNEFLITGLRTRWGVNLTEFEKQFGVENKDNLLTKANTFIQSNDLYFKNNALILSDKGVFISDSILAELMLINEHD